MYVHSCARARAHAHTHRYVQYVCAYLFLKPSTMHIVDAVYRIKMFITYMYIVLFLISELYFYLK